MRRLGAVIALVAAASLLHAAPARAAVSYTFSPTSGPVGTIIRFSGSGCPPTADNPDLGFVVANGPGRGQPYESNADGTFSGEYPVPPPRAGNESPDNSYETFVTCASTNEEVSAGSFTITAAPAPTTPPPPPQAASAPPSANSIAFDRNGEIFVVNADGTGERRIVGGGASVPSWSPDGTRIAFLRMPQEGAVGTLFIVNADGSNERRLLDGVGFATPSWSTDRDSLVVQVGQTPAASITVVSSGSGASRPVGPGEDPAWSPDGGSIAFTRDGDIFVVPAAGGAARRLRDDGAEPTWSPDGSRIAFVGAVVGSKNAIDVMNADGSGFRRLFDEHEFWIEPSWSPDGRTIIFSRGGNLGGAIDEIWTVAADGSSPARVLADAPDRSDHAPSFSADGTLLTFQSCSGNDFADPDTNCYVMVANADGSGLRRLGVGLNPVFLPNRVQLPATSGGEDDGADDAAASRRSGAARGTHVRAGIASAVQEPSDTSTDLRDLLTSALMAALLLLIVFPAELFNSTFEEHYDEITGWFRRKGRAARARRLPERALRLGGFVLVAAATAGLYGLLDPDVGADRATVAGIVGIAGAIIVVTLVGAVPGGLFTRSRAGEFGRLKPYPAALLIAGICVAVSRAVNFEPGYLYGIVAGFAVAGQLNGADEGRSALIDAVTTIAIGVAAWFAWLPVKDAASEPDPSLAVLTGDALLAACFVGAVEGLVFSLVPLRFLNGATLWAWRRLVWAALFVLAAFAFVHFILAPSEGYDGSVAVLLVLFAAFGLASVAFWGYFRLRRDSEPVAASSTFPIAGYDDLRAVDVLRHLKALDVDELEEVLAYELANKNRTAIVSRVTRILDASEGQTVMPSSSRTGLA